MRKRAAAIVGIGQTEYRPRGGWSSQSELGLAALAILDAVSGATRGTLGEPGKHLTGVAYHPHGKLLAAIDEEGTFRVWELASRKKVAEFGGSRRNLASGGEEHLQLPAETRLQFQLSAAVKIER